MRATNQNESIISQDRLAVTTERLQMLRLSSISMHSVPVQVLQPRIASPSRTFAMSSV